MTTKVLILLLAKAAARHAKLGGTPRRIIDGKNATTGTFPWMATVLVNANAQKESKLDHEFCGGSLIDENWVLTAAHCVQPEDIGQCAAAVSVLVGATNLDDWYTERFDLQGSERNKPELIDIEAIFFHPGYDPITTANDVAVLRLATPSKLPPLKLNLDTDFAELTQKDALVVGWGDVTDKETENLYRPELKYTWLPLIDDDKCLDALLSFNRSKTDDVYYYANDDDSYYYYADEDGGNGTYASYYYSYYGGGGDDDDNNASYYYYSPAYYFGETDEGGQNFVDFNVMFCAGYDERISPTKQTGDCYGDSGGPVIVPLVTNSSDALPAYDEWMQIGIVSWGLGCADTYGVYSDVAALSSFINAREYMFKNQSEVVQTSVNVDDVRLVGNDTFSGRLEVFNDGVWGTVCSYRFGLKDADVVCKQIFNTTATDFFVAGPEDSSTNGPIWLDKVTCRGSEINFGDCCFTQDEDTQIYCDHSTDVSLVCEPPSSRRLTTTVASEIIEGQLLIEDTINNNPRFHHLLLPASLVLLAAFGGLVATYLVRGGGQKK